MQRRSYILPQRLRAFVLRDMALCKCDKQWMNFGTPTCQIIHSSAVIIDGTILYLLYFIKKKKVPFIWSQRWWHQKDCFPAFRSAFERHRGRGVYLTSLAYSFHLQYREGIYSTDERYAQNKCRWSLAGPLLVSMVVLPTNQGFLPMSRQCGVNSGYLASK